MLCDHTISFLLLHIIANTESVNIQKLILK